MPDPQFFPPPKPLSLAEIAALTGARIVKERPGRTSGYGRGDIGRAGPTDIVFVDSAYYAVQLPSTRAGACLSSAKFIGSIPATSVALEVDEPATGIRVGIGAVCSQMLRGLWRSRRKARSRTSAHIDPTALLETGVTVGPFAVVGAGAAIGAGTVIGPNAVIGPNTRIGRDCSIGPGTTVLHALVGDRVTIHPGVRIGQDGFGYVPGAKGHMKVPQIGRVVIQDDVEIGANSTIDRGSIRDTIIGEGTKIDNLVQVAHNTPSRSPLFPCRTSRHLGQRHDRRFRRARRQRWRRPRTSASVPAPASPAKSGVFRDVPAGGRWGGYPARPANEWIRSQTAALRAVRQNSSSKKKKRNELGEDGE